MAALCRGAATSGNASFIRLADCGITHAFVLPKKRSKPRRLSAQDGRLSALAPLLLNRLPSRRCPSRVRALARPTPANETAKFRIAAMNVLIVTAPLDTRQLRAFVTLAKRGSFTQAARELHLSQSAVSHSMKALETDLGCRLFDRMSKKVLLTQAGEQLLQHADKILLEMSAARESLQ